MQTISALDSEMVAPVPLLVGANTNEADTFVFDGLNFTLPMFLYREIIKIVFGKVSGSSGNERIGGGKDDR